MAKIGRRFVLCLLAMPICSGAGAVAKDRIEVTEEAGQPSASRDRAKGAASSLKGKR